MSFDNTSTISLSSLKIKIYGASHADKIGIECEGLPTGEHIDENKLNAFLKRRAPGRGKTATPRKEADTPHFLSGLDNGTISGTLCAEIYNTNKKSSDYSNVSFVPRPGHADYPARVKFGYDYDLSGGGHFSGRMTAPLCILGGIALQLLEKRGIYIAAHAERIGNAFDRRFSPLENTANDIAILKSKADSTEILTLSDDACENMLSEILSAANEGDSVGGIIECAATGLPAGLGQHMFASVESRICNILFAVPAVKGVEFGEGFGVASMHGSQNNDGYRYENESVALTSNHAGGILGGMTSSAPIIFRVAIKPTPSIFKEQTSVDMIKKENTTLRIQGRHDPCIISRATPVIEAVCAIALLDLILEDK